MTHSIPNNKARSEWAHRHDLDPFMVLADLDVTSAPTEADPNRVRVTFWRLTRDDEGRINGRAEDTLYTNDAPPPQWLIPPKAQPRQLRALEVLAAAGIEGSDAITALDALLIRLGQALHRDTESATALQRHETLTWTFGSDALRVASVLATEACIRTELMKASIDGPDLDAAIIGTFKLMRAGRIGAHEAIDTTLEARRRLLLEGDDQDIEGDPA